MKDKLLARLFFMMLELQPKAHGTRNTIVDSPNFDHMQRTLYEIENSSVSNRGVSPDSVATGVAGAFWKYRDVKTSLSHFASRTI